MYRKKLSDWLQKQDGNEYVINGSTTVYTLNGGDNDGISVTVHELSRRDLTFSASTAERFLLHGRLRNM